MSEWIDARKQLPDVGEGWECVSDNVHVKLKSGKICAGFYDTRYGQWHDYNARRKISNEDVVEWKLMKP